MGNWFSNIQIRKREDLTTAAIAEAVAKVLGWHEAIPTDGTDGMLAIITDESSSWIAVCSDRMRHSNPKSCRAIALPLSNELNTDVMGIACFDSDFLYLNLINASERRNAWISAGLLGLAFGVKRLSNPFAWIGKIRNYSAFLLASLRPYILADSFLYKTLSCFELSADLAYIDFKYLDELSKNARIEMYTFK